MTAPAEGGIVDSRRTKLAGVVADRLIDDIVRSGQPVGSFFASEADLIERYGVSRAVLREAVRLVEHQHVARMRRGPGGGLIVDEPDADAVVSALILYFARQDTPLDEVFDARVILEGLVAELAAQRIDEDGVNELRAHLKAESDGTATDQRDLHRLIAAAAHNPALELFVECLNRMANFYVIDRAALTSTALDESIHAHDRVAAAVIAHQPDRARSRMIRHLRAEGAYIRARLPQDQRLQHRAALEATLGDKRAEQLAAAIFAEVMSSGAEPGDLIGSEAELMAQHQVSRAVFREAVRLLEHHRVALMKRGPRGGLVVAAPDSASVASVVALYLDRRGVTPAQLRELIRGVDTAVIEHLGEDPTRLGGLSSTSLRGAIESLSDNRALSLVAQVVARLQPIDQPEADDAVMAALHAGDIPLALHRLRQHAP